METPDHISALRVVGGNLALDFANTVEGTPEGEIEREHLLSYEDLVFWGCHVGILSGEDVERLLRKGHERPTEADTVYARALGFRGHLYGLFRAVAEG
ncbi:MAG TPA: ABATE domain-containing protein, partial [Rubrobacteraceae bacterium]|nr:ABATE domain-containing protein [Rubrobacteraceae bacterium]